MNDPQIVPLRYRRLLRAVAGERIGSTYRGGGERRWYWECVRCGKRLKPNNAGAQAHTAKHLLEFSDVSR